MTQTIVSTPIGSTGSLTVTESAGVLTLNFSEALLDGGIKLNVSADLGAAALLTLISDATSNATLKAALAEAAKLVAALPA